MNPKKQLRKVSPQLAAPQKQDQLKEQIKQKEELARLRKIVKEGIYPLVVETSSNIEDAQTFVAALSMALKQSFNNLMTKMKVSDLKIEDYLIDNDKSDRYKRLLALINDETITGALLLLDGFSNPIQLALREENLKRPLKDLKVDLLD